MDSLGCFEIIKTHKEFSYLYKKSKSFHTQSGVLFYLPHATIKKVGFIASKKVGNAVKRNRAKRLMRSLFITFSPNLKTGFYVFVAKEAITSLEFGFVEKQFVKNLQRSKTVC